MSRKRPFRSFVKLRRCSTGCSWRLTTRALPRGHFRTPLCGRGLKPKSPPTTLKRTATMASNGSNGKMIATQAALDRAIKNICDILRRDKAKGARLYVPELTWMLFLQALDIRETEEQSRLAALGRAADFKPA